MHEPSESQAWAYNYEGLKHDLDSLEERVRTLECLSSLVAPSGGPTGDETSENDLLRGKLAKATIDCKLPCHYCGLTEMAKCASGFPGCGLADDLMLHPDFPFEAGPILEAMVNEAVPLPAEGEKPSVAETAGPVKANREPADPRPAVLATIADLEMELDHVPIAQWARWGRSAKCVLRELLKFARAGASPPEEPKGVHLGRKKMPPVEMDIANSGSLAHVPWVQINGELFVPAPASEADGAAHCGDEGCHECEARRLSEEPVASPLPEDRTLDLSQFVEAVNAYGDGNGREGYTPGGWYCGEDKGTVHVFGPDGDAVAEVWGNLGLNSTAEANARLIAAAPAMKDEILSLRSRLEQDMDLMIAAHEADKAALIRDRDAATARAEAAEQRAERAEAHELRLQREAFMKDIDARDATIARLTSERDQWQGRFEGAKTRANENWGLVNVQAKNMAKLSSDLASARRQVEEMTRAAPAQPAGDKWMHEVAGLMVGCYLTHSERVDIIRRHLAPAATKGDTP